MPGTVSARAATVEILSWLEQVADPEIPVISVVDLGVVRDVRWDADELVVAITPTYSGCAANTVIALDIESALRGRGIGRLRLETRLAPPWTTDWISEKGRAALKAYGVAPPAESASPQLRRALGEALVIRCPRCDSADTRKISQFGSTPCKAQYQCRACLEPFDYFKCI